MSEINESMLRALWHDAEAELKTVVTRLEAELRTERLRGHRLQAALASIAQIALDEVNFR